MNKILLIVLFSASIPAYATTAIWTGHIVPAQSITTGYGWKCEYRYYGLVVWRVFRVTCPSTVEL